MNVTSLELSKELFELSGWGDTDKFWDKFQFLNMGWTLSVSPDEHTVPAYDLGFLLRKLPHEINGNYIMVGGQFQGQYSCGYYITVTDAFTHEAIADTPEDAACSLAITLFKEGILQK